MNQIQGIVLKLLHDIELFSTHGSGITLRTYQAGVARAIVESVLLKSGLTIVVMFPRQSGKNELQAQVEAYLLTTFSQSDGEIVKVSPTWKPQSLNAMRRLERILVRNLLTKEVWKKESGYIYKIGSARIFFLSGSPEAHVVGATASTLLEVDEAQDVLPSKFDKDIAPMAASTNATKVFWGTAWTSSTLLARELRAAKQAEKLDGVRRVFVMTADQVGAEVPEYKAFVAEQVAKLGRSNPMVRTQFFSEEIDAEGGLFPAVRQALMQGSHMKQEQPEAGKSYALLLDLAGEDEEQRGISDDRSELQNPGRDATVLTIVELDLSTLADPILKAPSYKTVNRYEWVGLKHSALYGQIKALAEHWKARYLVVDATGIGAGLASFLERAFPGRVISFVFNASTKSKLGWGFLAVVDSGRYKEYQESERMVSGAHRGSEEFWQQVGMCQYEVVPGPDKKIKWGVPNGTRDPATGELVHDDMLLSAALCAVLDDQEMALSGSALMVKGVDPLKAMDKEGF